MLLNFAMAYDTLLSMDTMDTTAPNEERRLYEISYTTHGAEQEGESVQQELRELIEKQGGMVQDIQSPKKYRDISRGSFHMIAPPSLAKRIETDLRAFSSPALKRVFLARWEKTAPKMRGHAFVRKPSIPQKEDEERAIEIDKQLDELLEKQL